jgi:hypothetical protein
MELINLRLVLPDYILASLILGITGIPALKNGSTFYMGLAVFA